MTTGPDHLLLASRTEIVCGALLILAMVAAVAVAAVTPSVLAWA